MKITDNTRTVEITIRRWNGNGWDPDWSNEFFAAAANEPNHYDEENDVTLVPDVGYCIAAALSEGPDGARWDGATEDIAPDMDVLVTELEPVDVVRYFPNTEYVDRCFGEYSALPEPGVRRVRATVPVSQSQCSGQ